VRFFVAGPQDIGRLAGQLGQWATWCNGGKPTPDASGVLAEQFANGDMTVVGVEDKPDGAAVAILVYSRKDFSSDLLGDSFNSQSHAAVRRGWVAPEHRGRGIAAAAAEFAHAQAARNGIGGIWAFVLVENAASRRLHAKLGFKEAGLTKIVTRFKRRRVGIRLGESAAWSFRRIPFEQSGL